MAVIFVKRVKLLFPRVVLRYANACYTGHCLFRGIRSNFTEIICFASLMFAHLVEERKFNSNILKRDQKKNRHYIAKIVDFQFRTYIFWLQLTKH